MLAQIITENGQKKIKPLTADAGAGNPVGTVIVVCSNQIPSNYLPLGTQYDTSLYPILYALLGTDTTPTASALGLPTLTSGQYAIKATSGLSENAQDNVVAQLNEQRSYSTEEHLTGRKWIDGKPTYEKVITFSNYTFSTGDNSISHGISNLGQLAHFEIFNNQNGLGGYFRLTGINATTINLNNAVGYALPSQNGFIILEYTKTT